MLEAEARDRVIVALDCGREEALALGEELKGRAQWVKIGMTLFYAEGPSIVTAFKERGFNVFLDLKVHDIPHQVRGAVRAAALTGADLITVHGLGSGPMLQAAREGAEEAAAVRGERPRVIAVTVLTSMDADALASIGVTDPVDVEASRLATLARESGLDGIVCSPRMASAWTLSSSPRACVPRARRSETRVAWPPLPRPSPPVPATWWWAVPSPRPRIP